MVGIISSVHLSEIKPIETESKVIVQALDNVLERFYSRRTPTINIIVEQSTLTTVNSELKPIELAGELIRLESDRTSHRMTYVIENHLAMKKPAYQRSYNIYLVDSYESFR